ncbi:helix-turn-helix transcriptional regulator [Amycolatopsis echigonensis]|uniref:Helix-turn-helix transcriptional regulator n=1 Tax=Amycolatopsis echigonensis TaxID=2576905 RepID=A0A8E1W3C4_9PSEU|nr:helix-turn-helix transcriptional regulator [Amycolatopsis echigonensis]MBB2502924.1 helix-turn-helix transcriptional regulator [Amycolatopsis echigonensis]
MRTRTIDGAKIRRVREDSGLTQAELAALLHADQSTVAKWEAGTRSPNLKIFGALCKTLRVTRDDLTIADVRAA